MFAFAHWSKTLFFTVNGWRQCVSLHRSLFTIRKNLKLSFYADDIMTNVRLTGEKCNERRRGGVYVFIMRFHTEGKWRQRCKYMLYGCLQIRMVSHVVLSQYSGTTSSTLASSQLMTCWHCCTCTALSFFESRLLESTEVLDGEFNGQTFILYGWILLLPG